MSTGWVAGDVRAKMLARRRLGPDSCKRVAGCRSLADALAMLDETGYRVPPERVPRASTDPRHALDQAQRAVSGALLWDLRVLAGWLPRGATAMMRALAGWFEIANITERLRELDTGTAGQYFELGALATAWPRLSGLASPAEVRGALATSAWDDPGGDETAAIEVGLRAMWARRVAALGEPARTWAAAAVVLLLASERFAAGRPDNPALRSVAAALLGRPATAGTLDELAAGLPRRLSWVLKPGTAPADLWRNEAIWWRRIDQDGQKLLGAKGHGRKPVIGAVVVLAADTRRVASALEIAARGGDSIEAFDAVA
jgi:hypothetical protein